MARLKWDEDTKRTFRTGISHMVLYVKGDDGSYGTGVPWNGVTAFNEAPSGAESNPFYADDMKYLDILSNEEFAATLEAYDCPDEFDVCDGVGSFGTDPKYAGVKVTQQTRRGFALSYMVKKGNDTKGVDYGYEIHMVYGCLASPSDRNNETINDSPNLQTLSWEISTTPVEVGINDLKKTAHIVLDSTKVPSAKMTAIQNALWGSETASTPAAHILLPSDLKTILDSNG